MPLVISVGFLPARIVAGRKSASLRFHHLLLETRDVFAADPAAIDAPWIRATRLLLEPAGHALLWMRLIPWPCLWVHRRVLLFPRIFGCHEPFHTSSGPPQLPEKLSLR